MSFNDLVRGGLDSQGGARLLGLKPAHKAHPLLKLIVFVLSVFLVFSKLGIFLHILLILFTALILFLSGCLKDLYKKLIFLFLGIYLFLFCVNWIFNKNPGFWDQNYLTNSYSDFADKLKNMFTRPLFSLTSSQGGSNGSTSNLQSGWFAGGEILEWCCSNCEKQPNCKCSQQLNGTSKIANASSIDELKKLCECVKDNAQCCQGGKCIKEILEKQSFKSFFVQTAQGKKVVVFLPKWYTITALQFILAFNMANKLTMIIALSRALSHTTDLTSFTFAVGELIRPLAALKMPVKEITLIISLAIRFIPSLLLEAIRIIKAQSSRGIDFKNGRFRDKVTAFLSLFIPLFIISMIKSKELANAMTSRAYLPKEDRTKFRNYSVDRSQLFVFGGIISFIILCYYFVFGAFYFSPTGMVDPILLLSI
ncbi:energy-coupling factor transporter transmembrane component T family protein [Mycoplasma suis]|uniref:Cobalt ABC transporter permease protein, CbiQ n=2 Tax=Mycoplasma suis TaxID=57372 RepID=F0QR16_MYCSL|nr:energy-coupling factor transporter transmembrane component T [Mycoplasma suis]ADX97936.1 cobalt ABC transporter permease protein, CbiQ [Mycoplasma suis str. Illinois]CBZ40432.1 similar to ABC-type cobalt transporter, permease subunit cibQ-family [Mycoplasma suis KI3806]